MTQETIFDVVDEQRAALEDIKQQANTLSVQIKGITKAFLNSIRLAEITHVDDHPHERAQATYYVLTLDFRDGITKTSCVQAKREYTVDDLLGLQVVCLIGETRKVFGVNSEALVIGVETDDTDKPLSLLTTTRPAKLVTSLY